MILFLITYCSVAQTQGYWDKERSTNKQIIVSARERIIIPVEELPVGTTEIVYRITLLDENQQLSNSLVSILKAIPDPTGISQGSAGAVFLLSKISGDDKCKYALFSNNEDTYDYKKNGKTDKACLFQDTAINKDAKRIAMNSSTCFKTNQLWFGFESKNWIMNQRIILEIVPWVDATLSRGWNTSNKQEIVDFSKKLKVYNSLSKKDAFSACFLETVMKKYTYKDYKSLLVLEKNSEANTMTQDCLNMTGEIKKYYTLFREQANATFDKGNYEEAIGILQIEIINKNRAEPIDFYTLGNFYLFTKQFDKAEETFNKGVQMNPNEIILKLGVAQLYLFTDRLSEAKEIHRKYKSQNVLANQSWTAQVKQDFDVFKRHGLPTKNFKKILRILD